MAWMMMVPQVVYAQTPKNVTVPELSPVSIKVIANDIDVPAQKVAYNVTGLPTWASLNAANDEITGTPGEADNGNSTVTISAYDGHGGKDSLTFTLTVTEVNSPPKISIIAENNTNTTSNSTATTPTTTPAAPAATNQTSTSAATNNTTATLPPSNQTSTLSNSTLPTPATGSNQTSSSFLTENNATLVPTPSTIKPGDELTLAGSGFGKSQQVTFMVDNSTLATSALVTTDANGAFTATATLPVSVTSGTHSISATSMNGIKAAVSITVQQQT